MKKINYFGVAVSFVAIMMFSSAAIADITFGVQAPRGNAKALKKWNELGKYLQAKIGEPVKIVPSKPNKTVKMVTDGKANFTLSNPVLAVALIEKHGSSAVATMQKKSGHQFGGVIISKKGSGITKSKDMIGKKVMAFKFRKSAAAYVFQVKHLQDQGIDAHKDFKIFKEAKKQDDIALAVKKGVMDAGFIKTGLLESMAKEGKVSMDDFEIVDAISDDFALVRSTQLYPSWTVTADSSVDKAKIEKVKSALMSLAAGEDASKKAKITGFVKPADMGKMTETLKALNLPPFGK